MILNSLTRRGLISGAFGLVSAAALPHPGRADDKRVLRVRSYVDIGKLDPLFLVSRATDGLISDAIFSRLIRYVSGTNWKWTLDAAEKIEQVDPTHVRFRLRPGIVFSNGYGEMTAEDVKYSFERYHDPKLDSPYKSDWASLDHVEVEDKLSGTIVLKEPYAPLFTTTLPWSAGFVLSKRAVEEAGGAFGAQPPAMSGAFQLKEWVPRQRIVLARNNDYYGEPSPFDEVVILLIADDKTAELGFEAGELDYTNVAVSSIPIMKDNPPKGGILMVRPSEAYYWIGMNVEHPLFQDRRVRQAIQYAVDVDTIIEAAFFGVTSRATGIVPPGMIGHREANLITGPDPEKARALLAEAGYPDGFETTISVLNQTDRVTAAQVIQAQIAQIGIRAEVLTYDSGTYWSLGVEADGDDWRDLQISFLQYESAPDPGWATTWFTCDQVGQWNWERWCNEEFSRLNAEGAKETDPAKRHDMYVRMQDLMERSGAYVFVSHDPKAVLYRDGIIPGNLPNNDAQLPNFRLA